MRPRASAFAIGERARAVRRRLARQPLVVGALSDGRHRRRPSDVCYPNELESILPRAGIQSLRIERKAKGTTRARRSREAMNHSRKRKLPERSLSFTKAFTERSIEIAEISALRDARSRELCARSVRLPRYRLVHRRDRYLPRSMDRYLFIETQAGSPARASNQAAP